MAGFSCAQNQISIQPINDSEIETLGWEEVKVKIKVEDAEERNVYGILPIDETEVTVEAPSLEEAVKVYNYKLQPKDLEVSITISPPVYEADIIYESPVYNEDDLIHESPVYNEDDHDTNLIYESPVYNVTFVVEPAVIEVPGVGGPHEEIIVDYEGEIIYEEPAVSTPVLVETVPATEGVSGHPALPSSEGAQAVPAEGGGGAVAPTTSEMEPSGFENIATLQIKTNSELAIYEDKMLIKNPATDKPLVVDVKPEKLISGLVSELEQTASLALSDISLNVEDNKPVYDLKVKQDATILWVIPAEIEQHLKVSAKDGKVEQSAGPWWGFFASGYKVFSPGSLII